MKILFATVLLVLVVGVQSAELFPVRDPEIGESRPGWWWSLWLDHVVVIEGTIEWKEDRDPEIQISADHEVLESAIGKEYSEIFQSTRKFRIGRIKPKKLLFASPGVTSENTFIAALAKGEIRDLQFLLPIQEFVGSHLSANARNGDSGAFIFRYGSMMTMMPLVFDVPIPKDGMASANAVFKHRNHFDHRIFKNQLGEQAGADQPATKPAEKVPAKDQPSTQTPKDAPR